MEQVRDVRRGGALVQGLLRGSLCTSSVGNGGGGNSAGGGVEAEKEISSDGEWSRGLNGWAGPSPALVVFSTSWS